MNFLFKKIEFFNVPFTADDADVVTFKTENERNAFFEHFKIQRPFDGDVTPNALAQISVFQWLDSQRNANISFNLTELQTAEFTDVNAFNYMRVTFTDSGTTDVAEHVGTEFYFFVERAERLYNITEQGKKYTYRFSLTLDVWQTYVLSRAKPFSNVSTGALKTPVLREFYLEQGNFRSYAPAVDRTSYGEPFLYNKNKTREQKIAKNEPFDTMFRLVTAFVFDGKVQLIASIPLTYEQCTSRKENANRLFNAIKLVRNKWKTVDYGSGWEFDTDAFNVVPLTCYIIPARLISVYGARNWDSYEAATADGGLPMPQNIVYTPDGELIDYQVYFPKDSDDKDGTLTYKFFRAVVPQTRQISIQYQDDETSPRPDGTPLFFGTVYTRISIPRRKYVSAFVTCRTGSMSNGLNITIEATGNSQPIDVTQNFTVPAPYSEAAQYFNQNGDSIALQNAVSVVSIIASVASQNYAGAAIGAINLTQNLVKQNEIRQRPETIQGSGYGDINIATNGGFAFYEPYLSLAEDEELSTFNELQGYLYGGYTGDAFNATGLLNLSTTPRGVTVDKCLYIRGDAVIYGVNAETGKWLKNKLKTTGLRIWKAAAYRAEMA